MARGPAAEDLGAGRPGLVRAIGRAGWLGDHGYGLGRRLSDRGVTLCEPVREGARWCVFVGVQATAVLPDDLREVLCPEGVLRGYVVDLFAEVEGSAQTGLVGRRKSPRRVELRVDRAGRLGEDWRVIGPVRALVRRDEPGQGPG